MRRRVSFVRRSPSRAVRPTAPSALGLLLVVLAAGCAATEGTGPAPDTAGDAERAPFPPGTRLGTFRTYATIGAPGQPESIVVADGRAYVTLSQDAQPSGVLLAFDLATGGEVDRATIPKAPGDPNVDLSRFLGVTVDARGRAYVADTSEPRVLRVDMSREPPSVETYATVPELRPCATSPSLGSDACAPTLVDKISLPNALAFTDDGTLYLSDTFQATIFRIPPGGGEPQVWFQDARFGDYGVNGLAVSPDGSRLYVAQTLVEPVSQLSTGVPGGAIHSLPLVDEPGAQDLLLVHHYPQHAVDGIAFGASGRLYATLVGQNDAPHGISILEEGAEVAFFPSAEENAGAEVRVHFPAAVAFDDARRSILIPNQAFEHPEWWAVLEAFVDDTAAPLPRPDV